VIATDLQGADIRACRSVRRTPPFAATMASVGRHRRAHIADSEFRLLFVCTGNICRSPFAEILTRHLLVGRLGGRAAGRFQVASAGVRALVGASMHPDTRAQLVPWGLHGAAADAFEARQLRPAMADEAHLVLGASPEHRSAVVGNAPAALPTAFSLREFARLTDAVDGNDLPSDPVARAHALVEEARMNRGLLPPTAPADDRIPDPMGREPDAHKMAAALIDAAVRTIIDVIAPPLIVSRGH
jgi:protein-tyrosine phosphatase